MTDPCIDYEAALKSLEECARTFGLHIAENALHYPDWYCSVLKGAPPVWRLSLKPYVPPLKEPPPCPKCGGKAEFRSMDAIPDDTLFHSTSERHLVVDCGCPRCDAWAGGLSRTRNYESAKFLAIQAWGELCRANEGRFDKKTGKPIDEVPWEDTEDDVSTTDQTTIQP